MADDLWKLSAVELSALTRSRQVSTEDVVRSSVERMRESNGEINAVTRDLGDAALATARAMDISASETEIELPPLFGIPVTIKDNIDVAGQSTPNGLKQLDGIIAETDSPVTRNLKRAGAIIIGRTNAPEFSYRYFTDNPLFGMTLNPWDKEVTPGGSSGGASAAAALGYGPIHHGNDLGGSLRYPAYCCGVATVRPTLGRVPAFNGTNAAERPSLISIMSVQGTIAREVKDVRLGTRIMAERDPRDPWWVPAPFEGPRPDGPIKVALTRAPAGFDIDPGVARALEQAARWLEDAGYVVEEANPPLVTEVQQLWRDLIMTETEVLSRAAVDQMGSVAIHNAIGAMSAISTIQDLEGYLRGVADRSRVLRDWLVFMEDYPLVLSPLSLQPAFPQNADQHGPQRMGEIMDAQIHMSNMNFLGLPAAVVPVGLESGIPIGVQIAGSRYREDMCLDAAEAIERNVGVLVHQLWDR
jgi:amidase